jgi:hypothetical protein
MRVKLEGILTIDLKIDNLNMPGLSGRSIVPEKSAVETAACDAKPAYAG